MIDEMLARLRAVTTVERWEVWEAAHFTRYRGVAGETPVFVWTDARGISARLGSPWTAPIYGPRGEEVPASPDPLLAVLRAAGIPLRVEEPS